MGQKFGQVDLVGAAHDRLRIVDHHQSFRHAAPREAVGEMVDRGRFAEEESVELGEPSVVVASDPFHGQPHRFADFRETLKRLFVRGRLRIARIAEYGEVVAGSRAAADPSHPAGEVLGGNVQKERVVGLGHFTRRDGRKPSQLPLLVANELGPQQRHGQKVKQVRGKTIVALGQVATEIDAQSEPVRLNGGQTLLDQFLQFLRDQPNHGLVLQVLDRRDAGQGLVAPRFGQQGYVIAECLVAVRTAEVEDLDAAQVAEFRLRQVAPSVDDSNPRDLQRPLTKVTNDDQNRHVRSLAMLHRAPKSEICVVRKDPQQDCADNPLNVDHVVLARGHGVRAQGIGHEDPAPA